MTGPDAQEWHVDRALALVRQNRVAEAERELLQSVRVFPDDCNILIELARVQMLLWHLDDATVTLKKAIHIAPDVEGAYFQLGRVQCQAGNLTEARFSLEQSLRLDPGHIQACILLGKVMQISGNSIAALQYYQRALEMAPGHIEPYIRLGNSYVALNDTENARTCFRNALDIQPDNPRAICGLVGIHAYEGDFNGAYRLLEPMLDNYPLDLQFAVALAAICRPLKRCQVAIGLLEEGLTAGDVDPDRQTMAHFSLGKLYDRQGKYGNAFHHYKCGNTLANRKYDPSVDRQWCKGMIATMNSSFFARTPRAQTGPGLKQPVFVIGMPRSGTTLVEQILSSHPAVHGAGELAELERLATTLSDTTDSVMGYPSCLNGVDEQTLTTLAVRYLEHLAAISPSDVDLVIDKMPGNYKYLGLVELLFPGARIIHCKRDRLDTYLSCYFQLFEAGQQFSYDLYNLGIYYNLYNRLMVHWKNSLNTQIMEISYEELVVNPDQVSRALIKYCGLDWSPAYLDFFKHDRQVLTASYDQVRQPIYADSVCRWVHYSDYLQPLREGLAQPPF